jgi:hypothetical protein
MVAPPLHDQGIVDSALAFAKLGIAVVPVHSPAASSSTGCDCRNPKCTHPAKHPRTTNGVKDSSSNPAQLEAWWNRWPKANVGIDLAGAGLLDIAPDSVEWLEEFHRLGLPGSAPSWQSGSGEGHVHFLFKRPKDCPIYRLCRPDEYDILTNGYSVVPPSVNVAGPYVWITSIPDTFRDLPEAPAWAVEMLRRAAPDTQPPSSKPVPRRDFSRPPVPLGPRSLQWWSGSLSHTKGDGEVDRSQTLFTIGLCLASGGASEETVAAAVAERDSVLGYQKYAGRQDGGDLEYQRIAHKAVALAHEHQVARVTATEPTSARVSPLKPGGSAIFEESVADVALWGFEDQVLWITGEPLMIYGPTGTGKTTVIQQLVLATIGVRHEEFVGLPVVGQAHWLYLALDRPAQIKRSLRRMVEPADIPLLDERLTIHDGPLDFDVGQEPERLLALAKEAGATAVAVDSLKDAAAGLEKPEVGQLVNRAFQLLVSSGIEVVVNHHPRKAQVGNSKPKAIDDVFGSRFIVDGCGSVVLLWGSPGDSVVELSHLKQPRDSVGPWTLVHDHDAGVTTVEDRIDAFIVIRSSRGITAEGLAGSLFKVDSPTRSQTEAARRKAKKLVKKGLVMEEPGEQGGVKGGTQARFFAVDSVHAPFTDKALSDSKSVHASVDAPNAQEGSTPCTALENLDSGTVHGTVHAVHADTVHDPAPFYREGGRDGDREEWVEVVAS